MHHGVVPLTRRTDCAVPLVASRSLAFFHQLSSKVDKQLPERCKLLLPRIPRAVPRAVPKARLKAALMAVLKVVLKAVLRASKDPKGPTVGRCRL